MHKFVLVKETRGSDTMLLAYTVINVSENPTTLIHEAQKQLNFYFPGVEIHEGNHLNQTSFWCYAPNRDAHLTYVIHKIEKDDDNVPTQTPTVESSPKRARCTDGVWTNCDP